MSDVPWGMPPFETFDELVSWVRAKRAQGRSREEVLKFLTYYLREARARNDDETQDLICDVLDKLTGFCSPGKEID